MGIEDIIQQLIGGVTSDPDLMGNLVEHPYSTVRETTGMEEVSRDQVSQALTAFSALASGQQVDFGNLSSMASQLLAENGGSAHSLAESLLGAKAGTPQETDMLSNLASVMFGKGVAGFDLSDGFGLDDIIGLASAFLGKKQSQ